MHWPERVAHVPVHGISGYPSPRVVARVRGRSARGASWLCPRATSPVVPRRVDGASNYRPRTCLVEGEIFCFPGRGAAYRAPTYCIGSPGRGLEWRPLNPCPAVRSGERTTVVAPATRIRQTEKAPERETTLAAQRERPSRAREKKIGRRMNACGQLIVGDSLESKVSPSGRVGAPTVSRDTALACLLLRFMLEGLAVFPFPSYFPAPSDEGVSREAAGRYRAA